MLVGGLPAAATTVHEPEELPHRRILEDVRRGQLRPQIPLHGQRQLDDQQRVAAELEEVVVQSDALSPE